ncbi:hypothetical protein CLOM_g8725 [Closterium sp. NIES-68]|nr:hypothetical protein CLOM_g8725 [Closterium sp. NIES-68]GJP68605.1 hypothetical protein CLOP_g25285 [Closterium sp. NIES-67]
MTNRVLCKYFVNGACSRGDSCPFSHDWKDKPNMACVFYQRGVCSFGDRCRYDHVKLKPSSSSAVPTPPPSSAAPTRSSAVSSSASSRGSGSVASSTNGTSRVGSGDVSNSSSSSSSASGGSSSRGSSSSRGAAANGASQTGVARSNAVTPSTATATTVWPALKPQTSAVSATPISSSVARESSYPASIPQPFTPPATTPLHQSPIPLRAASSPFPAPSLTSSLSSTPSRPSSLSSAAATPLSSSNPLPSTTPTPTPTPTSTPSSSTSLSVSASPFLPSASAAPFIPSSQSMGSTSAGMNSAASSVPSSRLTPTASVFYPPAAPAASAAVTAATATRNRSGLYTPAQYYAEHANGPIPPTDGLISGNSYAQPYSATHYVQYSPAPSPKANLERDPSASSLDGPDWLPRSASDLFDEGLPVMRMSSSGGASQRGSVAVGGYIEREKAGVDGAGAEGAGVGTAEGAFSQEGRAVLSSAALAERHSHMAPADVAGDWPYNADVAVGSLVLDAWPEGGEFASEAEFEDFVREASDFSAQAAALRIGLITLMDEDNAPDASPAAAATSAATAASASFVTSVTAPDVRSAEGSVGFAERSSVAAASAAAAAAGIGRSQFSAQAAAAGAGASGFSASVLPAAPGPAAAAGGSSSIEGYGDYGSGYGGYSANGGAGSRSSSNGYGGPISGSSSVSIPSNLADKPLCTLPRADSTAGACCARGPTCPFPHGDLCPHCGRYCLHPARPTEREEHMRECARLQRKVQALKLSSEIECSVCLERVLGKARPADRKFGILSHCDHPFCVGCIRNWRAAGQDSGESVPLDLDNAIRACPVCRVRSHFVTPSVVWFFSADEKQDIIEGYKRKLKNTDCRYFNYGNGQCPFGTSCFYKHAYRDGRLEEMKLRHLSSADGSAVISRDIRLSDFLGNVGQRR